MDKFLDWLGPVEDYDPGDPVYVSDFLADHQAPDHGCITQVQIGCDQLSSCIVLVDAATWTIPVIGVSQEGYAHGGFVGTIADLMEKMKQDIDMMRSGYGKEAQANIDEFLKRVDHILNGNDLSATCRLIITDPSGLSRVVAQHNTDSSDGESPSWITHRNYTRSFIDNNELGLVPQTYSKVPPSSQLKTAAEIARLVAKSRRVVCITGAGISVESGIPPFRSRGHQNTSHDVGNSPDAGTIWGSFNAARMTVHGFNSDKEVAAEWWAMKHALLPKFIAASPNPAHDFFAELEKRGQLRKVITQNIDSLHQRAGVSPDKVLELHGHMRGLICSDNASTPYNPIPRVSGRCTYALSEHEISLVNYFPADPLPLCPLCQEPLRTETVMFEQPLPEGNLNIAIEATGYADLLFVIGTSLVVRPVNNLPEIALRQGVPVIMINLDDTQYDEFATAVIREPAGQFMESVASHLNTMS